MRLPIREVKNMFTYLVKKTKYGRFLVVRKERGKEDFIVSSEDSEEKAKGLVSEIEAVIHRELMQIYESLP